MAKQSKPTKPKTPSLIEKTEAAIEKVKEKKPPKVNAFNRKFHILEELKQQGIERDPRLCIRRKMQPDGTYLYCKRWAIAGGTVCPKHGGDAPQVKDAAKRRMEALLLRKVERLDEISEQDGHMPSALGATMSLINRVMGKVGDAPKAAATGPSVIVGIAFKGDGKTVEITQHQPALPEPSVDAEVVEDDDDDDDFGD